MSIENPLWHPFADMGAVDGHRFVLTRGEGVWVYDRDGKRYFDATAALWVRQPRSRQARDRRRGRAPAATLDAYSIFADFANEPALNSRSASRNSRLGPRAASSSARAEGMIDAAAKIARSYFIHRGESERVHLISRAHGYHGTHGFGMSVAGIPATPRTSGRGFPRSRRSTTTASTP